MKITVSGKQGESRSFNLEQIIHKSRDLHQSNLTQSELDWARIENFDCQACQFKELHHQHCPAALSFAGLIEEFKELQSIDLVTMECTHKDWNFAQGMDLQTALANGLISAVVHSGCNKFMALRGSHQYFLPKPSIKELVFRLLTGYMAIAVFTEKPPQNRQDVVAGLTQMVNEQLEATQNFVMRIRDLSQVLQDTHSTKIGDALANAATTMTVMPQIALLALEDYLEEIANDYGLKDGVIPPL